MSSAARDLSGSIVFERRKISHGVYPELAEGFEMTRNGPFENRRFLKALGDLPGDHRLAFAFEQKLMALGVRKFRHDARIGLL